MSDLSAEQVVAFKTNSGFTAEQLGTLILCVLFAVLIVWGVWAIKTAYYGWTTKQLSSKEFVLVIARFGMIYCVLTFFLLS